MKMLFVCSQRVLVGGQIREAAVAIENGRIVDVVKKSDVPASARVHDYGNHVVFPGLVDVHVHINEPGRTEWEGFECATRAAAAGGITTVCDMPLNSSPVTTSVEALRRKESAAAGKLFVDVAFHGGLVPGNSEQIRELVAEGVAGIKAFMVDSGIEEFPASGAAELRSAMKVLAPSEVPLLVHAELKRAAPAVQDGISHAAWLASRPPEMEVEAIALLGALVRETGARVHIVHVSSSDGVALIRSLKNEGLPISAETCPHYLHFCSEDVPPGGTEFKCAPPIREKEHREALWEGLRTGALDLIASDHSPSPPEMKSRQEGDFFQAWGGIASLQFLLPACWTAASERRVHLESLGKWLCETPSKFLGLDNRKGKIARGMDADLHVWDPDEFLVLTSERVLHRHKLTPYLGRSLRGRPLATYLRGDLIYNDGSVAEVRGGEVCRRWTH